jgi:hypothetical protein
MTEVLDILQSKARGSYIKYKIVFKRFLNGRDLREYVAAAGDAGFVPGFVKQLTAAKD